MNDLTKPLLAELEQESVATRRLLERIPAERLSWKPTEVSPTLGELALHVAGIPRVFATFMQKDTLDAADIKMESRPKPNSKDDLLSALESSLGETTNILSGWSDEFAAGTWRLTERGKELVSGPRAALFRTMGMNHIYHHRGQLSLYLRLLGGPVPPVYGPTADESPF